MISDITTCPSHITLMAIKTKNRQTTPISLGRSGVSDRAQAMHIPYSFVNHHSQKSGIPIYHVGPPNFPIPANCRIFSELCYDLFGQMSHVAIESMATLKVLRVQTPKGQKRYNCSPTDTLLSIKQKVHTDTGIAVAEIELALRDEKSGTACSPLVNSNQLTLAQCGLK